jgi:hypothetical protein
MKAPKLKFNFKLTDYVEPHIIKLYVIVLISIMLLAILVVGGVNIYRYGLYQNESNKPSLYSEQDISSILKSPGLTDFIIPESLESGGNGFTLYRESKTQWTNDIVEHYIIPPDELGGDKISLESKKIIEQKLEDIP